MAGPGGADNALSFSEGQWLQLGEHGVQVVGNWSLECHIHVTREASQAYGERVLLLAADALDTVGMSSDFVSRLLVSMTDGWYQLVVTSLQADDVIRRTVFVDGVQMAQSERPLYMCGGVPCPTSFLAVGAGTGLPFPFQIHRLLLYSGLVSPNTTSSVANSFALLPFHADNSRWVEISRGLDGVDITWYRFGWERAAREQARVSLDPAGSVLVVAENISLLWDRAVASAGGITGDHAAVTNWSSAALNSTGAVGLQVNYIDSDPLESSTTELPVAYF